MAASAVLTDDSVQPATVKDIFFASVESKISIISVVRQNCPGCIYNCPSQRDHDLCLSVPLDEILNLYLPEIIENVPRRRVMDEFISKIDEKNIQSTLHNCITLGSEFSDAYMEVMQLWLFLKNIKFGKK